MKRFLHSILLILCLAAPLDAHRMLAGVTDEYVYFVAVDSTDNKTRETGLSSFTVYYSINGGAATAMTTPTVNETDGTNMPGCYELLIDEAGMTTLAAGDDTSELCLHITQASMAPVTRVVEIYRAKATAGETITVAGGVADASVEQWDDTAVASPATAGYPAVTIKDGTGTGELDTASGVVLADVSKWLGTAAATPTTAGVPEVDVTYFDGNALPTSAANAFSDLATATASTLEAAIRGELEKAIDGDPNTGSISERIKTMDDAYTAARAVFLDNIDNALLLELGLSEIGDKVVADVDANSTSAADALVAIHLDHLLSATYDPASKPGAADALFNEIVENDGGVSRYTANALEEAPTGGGTTQEIADAVRVEMEKAIDGDPNTGSLFERIKTLDDAYTATRGAYLDNIASKTGFSLASPQTFDLTGDITGNLSGSVGSVTGAVGSVTAGVDLADDAITSAKFDESTAFPLKSADTGATAVARTGADSDTLETLSDEIDSTSTHDAAAVKTAMEADGSKLDHVWETTEDDAGVRRFTTNALEQAPTGGGTTQDIADAVRVEMEKAIDGDPNAGSLFERIKTLDDAYTATRGAYLDNIASKTGFSLASPQTFDLTGDITGNLSGSVGSVTGAVGSVTAGVDLADDAITSAKFDESTAFALGSADTGATAVARVGADSDTLETLSDEIAAIAGDASAANQTTIINHLTDIKGPTWSADTDQLEDLRDRGDAAWTTGSGTGLSPIGAGTAQAGTGQTITLAAGSTFATSTLIGQKISIHSGTGIGQTNYITGYDATSKVARCLNPWFVTPDATSVYEIVAGEGRVLDVLLGKR